MNKLSSVPALIKKTKPTKKTTAYWDSKVPLILNLANNGMGLRDIAEVFGVEVAALTSMLFGRGISVVMSRYHHRKGTKYVYAKRTGE